MGSDLVLIPADRALSWDEAFETYEGLMRTWRPGIGHDRRLNPFISAIRARYPGIGRDPDSVPVEFDISRRHIFLGIGWSMVETFVPEVCELAWRNGLTVIDPQREVVGPHAPFADAPLGADQLSDHTAAADRMVGAIVSGLTGGEDFGWEAAQRTMAEQARSLGARMMSPLGFEITEDVQDEVFAHPELVPKSLQTDAWRDELLRDLAAAAGDQHRAVATLGAWGPDPAVAAALRVTLASDDTFLAGFAASGLARQGDTADLPALLELVHRFSPADGGNAEAMLMPLRAALDLGEVAGPQAVSEVKARAREWRGATRTKSRYGGDSAAMLDELLSE